MSLFEVIIRNSVELERVLSKCLSAKGPDLHAKLDSVRWRLPAALIAQVEYLITVRDYVVNAAVVPDDASEFECAFASVIQGIERVVGQNVRSAVTKTCESVKPPVIAPTERRVESVAVPMSGSKATTASTDWQIAQQDAAIEEMLDTLLVCSECVPGTTVPDKAPAPVVICDSIDETGPKTQSRQISMGTLLVRPSLE